MRSKKCRPAAKTIFATFATLLLMSAFAARPAQAQTFTVLHAFNGVDGAGPSDAPTLDNAGNIYGTTESGGIGKCSQYGCGAAFMLNKNGKQVGVYSFNGADGLDPGAGLLRGTTGDFYGTTIYGGDTNCLPPYGCGTVFKASRTGKETVLHKFTDTPDGLFPEGLIEDSAGNVYGTTEEGGANTFGTIFKIDTASNETIMYNFAGPPDGGADGAFPVAGVTRDTAGNLYGTTFAGGAFGAGAAYELETTGHEVLSYSFAGGSDGAQPSSALVFDSQGNLYGTTANGGNSECGGTGCGIVFELSPRSGGGWTEKVLYAFCSVLECADGEEPDGGLSRDSSGNIYGTTYFGGNDHDGVAWKLSTAGAESVLHSFAGGADGSNPVGSTLDNSGNLYGATQSGGAACYVSYTCGVVFKIVP